MMEKHNHLAVMNFEKTICENLEGVDYISFKDEYNTNDNMSLSFTVYRMNSNRFEFDMLICENFIIFQGQTYVIKEATPKAEGSTVSVEITAHHIMFEFQNHYIESNKSEDENNEEDIPIPTYTLKQYLEYGFKNQKIMHQYSFEIVGKFNKKVEIEELGGKNGIEYIKEGVELFNYIFYPKDDVIVFYHPDNLYHMTEKVIRYKYNTDDVSASVSTLDLRTVIKAYGKKHKSSETKNYQPYKPKDLSYTSDFVKEKTWGTEKVGGKMSVTINCKFGHETVRYTIKKGKDGGIFEAYMDGDYIGKYSCWHSSAKSETMDLIKNVSEGKHKLEFIFKGKDPKHDPPKDKKARFLVGTEKTNVINLIADISGDKAYKAIVTYESPNTSLYGKRFANTITNDQISSHKQLEKWAKSQIQDEPKTELTVKYLGYEEINHNDKIIFVHELMGFNTILKVLSITRGHPFTNTIDEVSFSNEIKDIVQIQQTLNRRLKEQDNKFNYQSNEINKLFSRDMSNPFSTEIIGSVLN